MTRAKDKGDRAEREIATVLAALTELPVRRKLGAGRLDDTGDLAGIPGWTVQVADWSDALRAVREKPLSADVQRRHAGDQFAVTLVRLRGGVWRAVLTPEQLATVIRTSLAPLACALCAGPHSERVCPGLGRDVQAL